MKADLIGRASMALGAGRQRIEDRIDYGAGVLIAKKPGEQVSAGDTILELLYNDDRGLARRRRSLRAITVRARRPLGRMLDTCEWSTLMTTPSSPSPKPADRCGGASGVIGRPQRER